MNFFFNTHSSMAHSSDATAPAGWPAPNTPASQVARFLCDNLHTGVLDTQSTLPWQRAVGHMPSQQPSGAFVCLARVQPCALVPLRDGMPIDTEAPFRSPAPRRVGWPTMLLRLLRARSTGVVLQLHKQDKPPADDAVLDIAGGGFHPPPRPVVGADAGLAPPASGDALRTITLLSTAATRRTTASAATGDAAAAAAVLPAASILAAAAGQGTQVTHDTVFALPAGGGRRDATTHHPAVPAPAAPPPPAGTAPGVVRTTLRRRTAGVAAEKHFVRLLMSEEGHAGAGGSRVMLHPWLTDLQLAALDRYCHTDAVLCVPMPATPACGNTIVRVTAPSATEDTALRVCLPDAAQQHGSGWAECWVDVKCMKKLHRQAADVQNEYITVEIHDDGWLYSPRAACVDVVAFELASAHDEDAATLMDGAFMLVDRAALAAWVRTAVRTDLPPVGTQGQSACGAGGRVYIRAHAASDTLVRKPDHVLTNFRTEDVWAAAGVALLVNPAFEDPPAVLLADAAAAHRKQATTPTMDAGAGGGLYAGVKRPR